MNKIFLKTMLSLIAIVMLASSCRKVEYDYINGTTPDERYNDYMKDVRNTLMNGTGWVGYLYGTTNDVAFTFFVDFVEDNRVVMYSDLDLIAAATPQESSYALRNVGTPSLIFDSYNYIHIPADPNRDVSGGKNGEGLNTDFEFSILSFNKDTVQMLGNLNSSKMTLVRISEEDKAKLAEGDFKSTVETFQDFLATNKNTYIELPDGKLMGLNFSDEAKSVSLSVENDEGGVTDKSATFYYSLDGATILDDFGFEGIRIIGAEIVDGKMIAKSADGQSFEVKQSNHPITPLSASFGSKSTYTKLHISGDRMPEGVTSDFTSVFNSIVTKVRNSGYSIQGMDVALLNSTDMQIHIDITSLSSEKVHYAEATFDYVRDENNFTFSNYRSTDGVGYWARLESELKDLWSFFNNATLKIDWAEGSGSDILGGFYPINNPNNFFYGILR